MFTTVREILKMKEFDGCTVAAGEAGLSREVGNATLMEVPDIIPYVEAHSLLITTLYPIANDADRMEGLIGQLHEKHVAGICIKPLRYIEEIPSSMLEQAERLGFPVIRLPQDANLSRMVNAVLSVSIETYIETLRFRDYIHRTLMQLLLENASIDTLVLKLAEILQEDILLLGRNALPICRAGRDEQGDYRVYGRREAMELPELETDGISCNISTGEQLFGTIYLPRVKRYDEKLKFALEQAAMLFTVVFYKEDIANMQQKAFRDVFIRDLLQGKVKSRQEYESKCEVYGFRLRFPQVITVIRTDGVSEERKRRFYHRLIEERYVEKWAAHRFSGAEPLHAIYHDDAVVILQRRRDTSVLVSQYENLLERLKQLGDDSLKISIGISNEAAGYDGIARAFRKAMTMARVGSLVHDESFITTYEGNRNFELIENIADKDLVREYVEEKLGAVIAYDRENNARYMETLHLLLQNDFNLKRASESAYVHYNTLRYRVSKLQQIGIDCQPGKSFLDLTLAYDMYLWLKATNNF